MFDRFQQLKPKLFPAGLKLQNAIIALVYQDLKSESGSFTGGFIYKLLRPIFFTLFLTIAIKSFRTGFAFEEGIQYLFLNFLLFFFFLEQAVKANKLTNQNNLVNIPNITHAKILLAQTISSLVLFLPQLLIAFLMYYYMLDKFDYLKFLTLFTFTWLLGSVYVFHFSLFIFNNNALISFHEFFTRTFLFISAVFYHVALLSDSAKIFILLNPLVHIMEISREFVGFPDQSIYSTSFLISTIFVGVVLIPVHYNIRINYFYFKRIK